MLSPPPPIAHRGDPGAHPQRAAGGAGAGPRPACGRTRPNTLEAMSGYTVLRAADAFWRPSNATGVDNTDLGRQLGATTLGARLWRLRPGQTITRHRHREQVELYVVLEGTGRIRVGQELLTLEPLSALLVQPRTLRQPFNDTDAEALWLICGAPVEAANTLEMTAEQLADLYPDGTTALPPELGGSDWPAAPTS